MISTRIRRGAVRTHVLIRNKIETYNSSQVRRSVRTARTLTLGVIVARMAVLTVPVVPTAHAAALPDMPADTEPPSIVPAEGTLQEGDIDGVTFDERADGQDGQLAPFSLQADGFTVEVGKSRATEQEEAEKAKAEAQAKAEQAKKKAARKAVLAAAAAAPVTGDVVGYVHDMAVQAFGEAEWPAFYQIVQRESGFNPSSYNSRSGACGLFQALPCAKMGGMELENQVRWGINYIRNRYSTPSAAWVFWQLHHWY